MGSNIFDQYTLLHFASGVIAYFFGINFWVWVIIHTIFEITENTQCGMRFINNYLTFWPGGKPEADGIINSVGDTVGASVGWLCAKWLDDFVVDSGNS